MKERVALVVMPFASAGFPVLGVSLLQAGLRRENIPCDLHYLNLTYAAHVGLERYHWLAESPQMSMMGEWVFARELFGDRLRPDSEYRQEILFKRLGHNLTLRNLLDLFEARNHVGEFLDKCLATVDWSQYGLVGFSTTFEQNLASMALASRLKQKFPDMVIVLGGNNCEGEMGVALHQQFPCVDYVCSGIGDIAFPELVKRVFSGRAANDIDGIIARVDGQTSLPGKMANPVAKLDELPIPSYDDYYSQLSVHGFDGLFAPLTPVETARGCWWGEKMHCTFCGLNGGSMAYLSKSPQRVLHELEVLGERYGRSFVVVDNILDLKYLNSLFPEIIERKLDYSFHYETKVNLKKHQLKVLREAGTRHLQPGIESLSSPILKMMKKGCTALQNIQFLKWCNEYGIRVSWNLLFGFPGEDPAEYAMMVKLLPSLYHLQSPDYCARVRPDRFSPYFTRPQEFGLQKINHDRTYPYVYPFEPEVVRQMAYFFEFEQSVNDAIEEYSWDLYCAAQLWQNHPAERSLTSTTRNGQLLLIDERSADGKREIALPNWLGSVYQFCDETRSLNAICEFLATNSDGHAIRVEELKLALDSLVEQRLMVSEGSTYLSLAIPAAESQEALAEKLAFFRQGSPWLNWKARAIAKPAANEPELVKA